MEYKILLYHKKYFHSFSDLLINNFKFDNTDKEKAIYWKFFDAIHNNNSVTYIATDKKHVIAQYTNLPYLVCRKKTVYASMLCADMTTHEKYRGQGLISILSKKVYAVVQSKNVPFTIGFSNDSGVKVDKYSKGYGYVIVGNFVRYFKLLVFTKKSAISLVPTRTFSKSWKCTHSSYFKIDKSLPFLTYRYIKKPNNTYDLYELQKDSTPIGYVVIRKKRSIAYLYDLILTSYNLKSVSDAVSAVEYHMKKDKMRIFIMNVLDNPFWQELARKHHLAKRKRNKVNHHLTIKIHGKIINKETIYNKDNWFLMGGDIL